MKTLFKKIICLILIVSMIFSISACAVKEDYKVAFDLLLDLNYIEFIKYLPYYISRVTPEKIAFAVFGYSDLLLDENWIIGKTSIEVQKRYGGRSEYYNRIIFPLGAKYFDVLAYPDVFDCYVVYFRDGEAYLIEKCDEDAGYRWGM